VSARSDNAFLPADPDEVKNKFLLETRARRALAEKGIGGYYNRYNPLCVRLGYWSRHCREVFRVLR
jgi:hypothetical protein